KSPAVGEINLPLRQVALLSRAATGGAAGAGAVGGAAGAGGAGAGGAGAGGASPAGANPAGAAAPSEDVVTLGNGDTVRGIISEIADGNVTVQVGGAPTPVPFDSVQTISFAATGAAAQTVQRAVRVRLADDSVITAPSVRTQGDQLVLALGSAGGAPGAGGAGGAGGTGGGGGAGRARQVPLSAVTGIEQLNGPVSWLSSRQPGENVQTPFLETARPARMDRTVAGRPIRFGDRAFARGIGVAPYSRLVFPLDAARKAGYQSFRTQYAVDGAGQYADVTVRIKLDDAVVHEKPSVTAGALSPVIVVPLGGSARTLTLEVDFGGNYNVQDRLNWIEPALVKQNPVPPSSPPPAAAVPPAGGAPAAPAAPPQ
ncbi:MAG TPA: NPCBM/NEW2 domain-containing protein, partial [Tepidisphaeraceae bacterium]|nr:NPCBM/NEW2 domain-containing protein [Tepidisphaeraceae bacterium]